MKWHDGDLVVVDPVDQDRDPYIFQFQNGGTVTRRVDGGYMIKLVSATGEWGPVPGYRLRPPR